MGSSPCHIKESMDNREFPTIGVQKMDPKLYKAAMEGDTEVLTSTLTFCSSLVATILLIYANACSNDEFLISSALKTSSYIAGVSILATITAFMTGVHALMSNECLWLAIMALSLGCAVPIFLMWYSEWLEEQ
ncbi:hypothetical protein AAC387_Pa06g2169 [Persea americana]